MKYRTDDVVFASMDAQLYVDFCVGVGAESEDRRPSTSRTSRRSSSSRPEATYRWVSRGGVMVEAGGDRPAEMWRSSSASRRERNQNCDRNVGTVCSRKQGMVQIHLWV